MKKQRSSVQNEPIIPWYVGTFLYLFVGIIATNVLMHLNFVQIQYRDRPKWEERFHFISIVLTWPFIVSWFAMFEFIIPLCIYVIDTCMFVSQK